MAVACCTSFQCSPDSPQLLHGSGWGGLLAASLLLAEAALLLPWSALPNEYILIGCGACQKDGAICRETLCGQDL